MTFNGYRDSGLALDLLAAGQEPKAERNAHAHPLSACGRHAIYEGIEPGDRQVELTLDAPLRIDSEVAGADRDRVALLEPHLADFDPAAGLLDFAKACRPRLGREIMQPAQHRIDAAIGRGREQRPALGGLEPLCLKRKLDDRPVGHGAFGKPAVNLDMAGARDLPGGLRARDDRLAHHQRDPARRFGQAADARLRELPVRSVSGRTARIADRQRSGQFADQ